VILRLGVAAIGLSALLPAVIFGGQLAVDIMVGLAVAICVAEYATMAFPSDRWAKGGVLAAVTAALYATVLYSDQPGLSVALALCVVASLVFMTLRPGETLEGTADDAGRIVLGAVWLCMLAFLVLLRREEHGLGWLFLVLATSWLGDTGGYFSGRAFGSRKLYPRVSPKKTWEGVAGGVTLSTAGALVVRYVGLSELSVVDCLLLGVLLSVAGVVGDLSESMLKRSFEVKDSGWVVPGHGGLLDRIDSVLFAAPLLYGWVILVEG